MKLLKVGLAALAIATAAGSAANASNQILWFYGTGDSAGGFFRTDGAGTITSGVGVFNTSLGMLSATIAPGAGADTAFIWDNKFPVDINGPLFRNADNTLAINVFDTAGVADVGVTSNISLYIAPTNTGVYPVADIGTLTISSLGSNVYEWFYGTGDSAGGFFNVDGAGAILSGKGIFNTSLGSLKGSITPGAGSDHNYYWDNIVPIDLAGALFLNSEDNHEFNLYDTLGVADLGVTHNVSLDISPIDHQQYLVTDVGTLTLMKGVPEPGAWALMLGGFGLAGAALRRRRAVLAAV